METLIGAKFKGRIPPNPYLLVAATGRTNYWKDDLAVRVVGTLEYGSSVLTTSCSRASGSMLAATSGPGGGEGAHSKDTTYIDIEHIPRGDQTRVVAL
jgi:hypothetical protein